MAANALRPRIGLAPDDDRVELVVRELRTIAPFGGGIEPYLQTGRLIVNNFYHGDLARWRLRGRKEASFRRLARHPDLPMSAGTLYRTVAIYELCQRAGVSEWKHLTVSHLRAVLSVPHPEQLGYLKLAEAEKWTTIRLETELSHARIGAAHSRGRPRRPLIVKTLRAVLRYVDRNGSLLGAGEDLASLPDKLVPDLAGAIAAITSACDEVKEKLSRLPPQRSRLLSTAGNTQGG